MATGTKKTGAKRRKSGGASSKTRGSKAGAKKAASQGKCSGWKAWHDRMPPGPATLHVVGKCRFPKHGFKVRLKKAVPQGINPAILLLQKVVRAPSGPVIQTPEIVEVHYRLKTNTKYTHVTILPEGKTIRVKEVS